MAHATTKKQERSSLFSDAGAISKFRQEELMIVWTISIDQTCVRRLLKVHLGPHVGFGGSMTNN
jgi:hypothetical protein